MKFDWSKESKQKVFDKAQLIINKFNEENKSDIKIDKARFVVYKESIARVYIQPVLEHKNERIIRKLRSQSWFMEREIPGKGIRYSFNASKYNMIGVIQIELVEGALLRSKGIDTAERGIEFNDDMLTAIKEGKKKTFRKVIRTDKEPYSLGEVCYIKEAWAKDEEGNYITKSDNIKKIKWLQNRKMPKEAAKRFIRILSITREYIREIDEVGSTLEGFVADNIPVGAAEDADWLSEKYKTARMKFKECWDKSIAKDRRGITGWYGNPEVWVVEFELVKE